MTLPEKIRQQIADEPYKTDDIGMSESSVLIFEDKVLKIQACGEEAENEHLMLRHLWGKLPVPPVYSYEIQDGRSYLLMGKCPGKMACSEEYMENPLMQVRLLADGLKKLWAIDISHSPSNWGLKRKLAQAEYNIENGLVDLDNVEPDTFSEKGFANPAALLQWLYDNRPEEDLVLSHGDYCLPNVFGIRDRVSGYIDLGKTGIADRWCDIALCYRSLSHNFNGKCCGKAHPGCNDLLLFRELGLEPDWKKIRYYILLDELF